MADALDDLSFIVELLTIELSRDDWYHIHRAAGRMPFRRHPAPRALEIAWGKLSHALRDHPRARRMTLALTRGEHTALQIAADGSILGNQANREREALHRFGLLLHPAFGP